MIEIELTPTEMLHGALAGVTFRLRAMSSGRKGHRYGMTDKYAWHFNIESALAELALAKYKGVYWAVTPLSQRGLGDVGEEEVRQTDLDNGRLIMHPDDKPDRKYWLVTGNMGSYKIRGWIYGRDAMLPEWWDDPTKQGRPAFFVPQSALRCEG